MKRIDGQPEGKYNCSEGMSFSEFVTFITCLHDENYRIVILSRKANLAAQPTTASSFAWLLRLGLLGGACRAIIFSLTWQHHVPLIFDSFRESFGRMLKFDANREVRSKSSKAWNLQIVQWPNSDDAAPMTGSRIRRARPKSQHPWWDWDFICCKKDFGKRYRELTR